MHFGLFKVSKCVFEKKPLRQKKKLKSLLPIFILVDNISILNLLLPFIFPQWFSIVPVPKTTHGLWQCARDYMLYARVNHSISSEFVSFNLFGKLRMSYNGYFFLFGCIND